MISFKPISHVFVCSWLPVHKHLNRGPTSGFVPSSSSEQPNTTMPRSGQIRYYSQAAAAAAGTSVGRSGNDDVFMNENHGHNEWSNETKSKSCCSLVVRFLLSLSFTLETGLWSLLLLLLRLPQPYFYFNSFEASPGLPFSSCRFIHAAGASKFCARACPLSLAPTVQSALLAYDIVEGSPSSGKPGPRRSRDWPHRPCLAVAVPLSCVLFLQPARSLE